MNIATARTRRVLFKGQPFDIHDTLFEARMPQYFRALANWPRSHHFHSQQPEAAIELSGPMFDAESPSFVLHLERPEFAALVEWVYTNSMEPLFAACSHVDYWEHVGVVLNAPALEATIRSYRRSKIREHIKEAAKKTLSMAYEGVLRTVARGPSVLAGGVLVCINALGLFVAAMSAVSRFMYTAIVLLLVAFLVVMLAVPVARNDPHSIVGRNVAVAYGSMVNLTLDAIAANRQRDREETKRFLLDLGMHEDKNMAYLRAAEYASVATNLYLLRILSVAVRVSGVWLDLAALASSAAYRIMCFAYEIAVWPMGGAVGSCFNSRTFAHEMDDIYYDFDVIAQSLAINLLVEGHPQSHGKK